MKVLQIVPYLAPYVGGQERYVQNLSKNLVRLGNEVDIATSNYPESDEFEELDGFTVRRYKCLARPMRNPITPALFSLSKIVDHYDVIHTHNEHAFSALVASHLSVKHDIPLVLTCHGRLRFGNDALDAVEKAYTRTIARRILRAADAVCVNSPLDREYISSVSSMEPSKIWEVSNAIDPAQLSQFRRGPVREEIKNVIESGGYKVLFVGNLIKRKGVESLVRAIGRIAKTDPGADVSLIIVGDGEERQNVLRLIGELGLREKVHFVGSVSDAELAYLYEHSGVLVLPSLSEVCPTVVLEAMYFGLPVIASDIPGIRDHFNDTAWLVPTGDDAKMASSILTLAQSPDLVEWMSTVGRDLVLKKYTWDSIARAYQSVYDCVSGSGGAKERSVPEEKRQLRKRIIMSED